jgi:hypothetical protein
MIRKSYQFWVAKSKTNPILFNCANAFVLFGLGDLIQQKININQTIDNFSSKTRDSTDSNLADSHGNFDFKLKETPC